MLPQLLPNNLKSAARNAKEISIRTILTRVGSTPRSPFMQIAVSSATVRPVNDGKVSARADYRRRIQQRQTVIFGTIAALMAVLLLFAMLFWTNIVPFPFDREFSAEVDSNTVVTPCIADGTAVTDLSTITANVYNSTSITGIAAEAATALTGLGVAVGTTENWSGDQALSEPARIQAGSQGITAAYTLAQYIPDSIIQYNSDLTGETINVILGTSWNGISSADSVASANPDVTLSPVAECTTLEDSAGN